MKTLIIAEHDNQSIQPSIRQTLTAASLLPHETMVLVAGHGCGRVAEEAASCPGVSRVLLADDPCFAHQQPEVLAPLILTLRDQFSYVLATASTFGKNLLPRIAAQLDVAQLSDVNQILDAETFAHPIYAGNAIETVRLLDEKKVLTIRTTAFDAVVGTQSPCPVERLHLVFEQSKSQFIEQHLTRSSRPELGKAQVVVSGGRGLQSAEKFKIIETLADTLGAAMGASRAAVDAGFVSNDHQVGQTGKIVAPALYFAIGISGAIQHVAGMKDSKVIVAINKDPDAPIFKIATYGLVGDLFTIVPELIEKLKEC